MTYAMREEIFSKEYLSIEDVQELLGMSYGLISEDKKDIIFYFEEVKNERV